MNFGINSALRRGITKLSDLEIHQSIVMIQQIMDSEFFRFDKKQFNDRLEELKAEKTKRNI